MFIESTKVHVFSSTAIAYAQCYVMMPALPALAGKQSILLICCNKNVVIKNKYVIFATHLCLKSS